MNVKIFHIKVGDKIVVKQRKQSKLATLYKSEPCASTGKKRNTVTIRDAYGNERVRNVAGVPCFRGGSNIDNRQEFKYLTIQVFLTFY